MAKICCIGDRDSIKGFAALGLDIFVCEEDEAADKVLKQAVDNGYAVIYITEYLAALAKKQVDRIDKSPDLCVVPIPSVKANSGIGVKRLSEAVEKAVGSDIIFNKESTK